ncbi:MAG: gas vesicle protein K [Pseudomonadota bacterium]
MTNTSEQNAQAHEPMADRVDAPEVMGFDTATLEAAAIDAMAVAAARAAVESIGRRAGDAEGKSGQGVLEDGSLSLDPDRVERDLTRLVLCLIEFLRQLMEAQAVRRMEAGRLTPEQEEEVGLTLMRARERLLEVADKFGLSEDDLHLDLGPLGKLV